jgi:hypothetical protein
MEYMTLIMDLQQYLIEYTWINNGDKRVIRQWQKALNEPIDPKTIYYEKVVSFYYTSFTVD